LVIPPPQSENPGAFSLAGREYAQEPLEDFRDPHITDSVLCFGSQTGKTTIYMVGAAWLLAESPTGLLWVMPNAVLAQSFAETRWIPVLLATAPLARVLEGTDKRYTLKRSQQTVGSSLVNFVGSNSPANLASRPVRIVIMDEVDKFDRGGTSGEADAANLAEQRTKTFAMPKRFKSSTPTVPDGIIWQEFLKGDQRRRFVPCPGCGAEIVLIWSKDFTVFEKTGCEASVKWDPKAALRDHKWDYDLVGRTAHAECPYCNFEIRDHHKTLMNRNGRWKSTSTAASHFVSRHLPSLYAVGPQTSFGTLAVKFLQAKRSMLGLQGFVNGDLAEPWEHQDTRGARLELILDVRKAAEEQVGNPMRLMAVDCQGASPYFWYVVRDWAEGGHSRLVAQGHADTWDEIRQTQLDSGVPDAGVIIDSGFQAADVYMRCLQHGQLKAAVGLPVWRGWMPSKGRERDRAWKDAKTGATLPYVLGSAPLPHRRFLLPLLEFNGDMLLSVLAKLRKGPEKCAGIKWEVVEGIIDEEYWRHMDAKVYVPKTTAAGKVEYQWTKRSHYWPDHLLDCEIMQMALATFHWRLPWGSVLADI